MELRKFLENILYYGLESFGRFYSSYRGYVIDNNDPDNLGKIKVNIPIITKSQPHPVWAYPKNQMSGNGYGIQLLPVKGALVWIEFDHGDTKFPIWSHAHYSSGEKPEEFISPEVYGFKTPRGQTIIIDDRDGEEKIIINHGENDGLVKVIELTEKLNNIEGKVNDFLSHYRSHQLVDPISGMCGPLLPAPPAPLELVETKQSEIENEDVQH